MNKSLLRVTAFTAAAAAMSGCASVAPSAPGPRAVTLTTPTCTHPEVQVSINQVNISGSTATIKVDPGKRKISNQGTGIRWNIGGNKYSFTADGITFNKANYPNQPYGPIASGPGSNPTEFVVCFGDTTAVGNATWYYNIKFFANASPSTVWICDPTVVNSASLVDEEQLVNCVIAGN